MSIVRPDHSFQMPQSDYKPNKQERRKIRQFTGSSHTQDIPLIVSNGSYVETAAIRKLIPDLSDNNLNVSTTQVPN